MFTAFPSINCRLIQYHVTLHYTVKKREQSYIHIQPILSSPSIFSNLSSFVFCLLAKQKLLQIHLLHVYIDNHCHRKKIAKKNPIFAGTNSNSRTITKGSIPQKTHSKLLCGLEKVELEVCNLFCRAETIGFLHSSSRLINPEKKKNKDSEL